MTRRALREYVSAYLEEVGSLQYADISKIQPAPFASLARGAGGIVYVLWRLGHQRAARRWLSALRADRRRHAYQYGANSFPSSSFMYGRAGIHWLDVLLDPERSASSFARFAPELRDSSYMHGAAGYLTACRILLARTPQLQLERVAGAVADWLLAQAREARPWSGDKNVVGFAPGWPGALHALLAWREHIGESAPDWLVTALRNFAQAWSPERVRPGFMATWCNGATGMTLLWTKAFALTNDEQFFDAARSTATLAMSVEDIPSFLCCGLAGVAYSLLELGRHDPNGPWSELALDRGLRAVSLAQQVPLDWPNGLYVGHPGIVCLAAELLGDGVQGFPAITV